MNELPDDDELYPHVIALKHKDDPWGTGLKAVKWLESRDIMINRDFILTTMYEDERIALSFRKKKTAKLFKKNKKAIRDEAQGA